MIVNSDIKIENYYIAYFDILGYKEKMIKFSVEDAECFLKKVNELVNAAKETMDNANSGNSNRNFDLRIKMFSDNLFMCTKSDWFNLISAVAYLQALFVSENMFIRGALYHGELYINDDYIYGKGLMGAHALEDKVSIFPRVIIDNTFIDAMKKHQLRRWKPELNGVIVNSYEMFESFKYFYFSNDFDNNKYIDYLTYWQWLENDNMVEAKNYPLETFLSDHKEIIELNLTENKDKKAVLQKYEWCKTYHNKFCEKNNIVDKEIL